MSVFVEGKFEAMPREDVIEAEEQRAKDGYHLIRMRLERLQQNIHRPAPIPTKKETLLAPKPPPEFVRNVVGSSAAAGSAEFHIYRNNRRKECERLEYIDKVAKLEEAEKAFQERREEVERAEEERTQRKRAKRQRRKDKMKKLKMSGKKGKKAEESSSEDSDDDEDEQGEKGSGAEDETGAQDPAPSASRPVKDDDEEEKEGSAEEGKGEE